ncbi:MAG TPA: zinc dependent phospholipase C family protein [Candidatus Faecousia intestinigallinarum]|nr:zinc dependent phospholipase C family protein [Candidatus Faecousia intestinigallinarum]
MPSNYAHYRFGVELLSEMPKEARKPIVRFRRLYDVGLHGPDLFFYYNPLRTTRVGSLGARFHAQSGQEFFGRVCRDWRFAPNEAGLAYLFGLLAHYCLDSACHPFVNAQSAGGNPSHVQIETEFDRFLLEMDGKTPPHTQALTRHLHLTAGECATVARFYPGSTSGNIRRCVQTMALCGKLLAVPEGGTRQALTMVLGKLGETGHILMPASPDPQCRHLDAALLAYYQQAQARYPALLQQLQEHLRKNTPLGADFAANFG